METFFTSDTHFGHANIIKFCNRPFTGVEEMNEALVENWNKKVKPGDLVYHLGDFSMKIDKFQSLKYLERLNGNIEFIPGNHDGYERYWAASRNIGGFNILPPLTERTICGQNMVLCHYALRTWHHDLKGTWHLFGHSHNSLPSYGRSRDVGVDTTKDFAPIHFYELKTWMDSQTIGGHPKF